MMVERNLQVSGTKSGVAEARAWACAQLEGSGGPVNWRPDYQVVALLVSELVTNAVRHGSGAEVLRLMWDERRLRIAVDDASAELPVMRAARPDRPGGHGMNLVRRLAGGWGAAPRDGGKRVWADLVPGWEPSPA
ncbi:ATP-binding protein [Streptomyces sp. NPDC006733]|uniref:ATP-binding protein n=1 Tax=Streptomyces sp. NPDC006733 TaxID=3155460 RepID=UPI0033CF2182